MSEIQSKNLAAQLKSMLEETFQPVFLKLENDSHLHRTPMHAETHFQCIMVSRFFEGLSSVKRHQAVFQAIFISNDPLYRVMGPFAHHSFTTTIDGNKRPTHRIKTRVPTSALIFGHAY